MPGAAPIGDRRGEGQEQQVAAGYESGRQAVFAERDLGLARERGVADATEHAEIDEMVLAEALGPFGRDPAQRRGDGLAAGKLHLMALTVIDSHPLPPVETSQPPA